MVCETAYGWRAILEITATNDSEILIFDLA